MRAGVAILVLLGVVTLVLVSGSEEESGPVPAPREATARGDEPQAPVARCADSTTAAGPHDPIGVADENDALVGPVRILGLGHYAADWEALVREDRGLKAPALVDPGSEVTLEVPEAQRVWMRLSYGGRSGGAVTLQACRRKVTVFVGGFTVDYAQAPEQGRCAQLIVWVAGQATRVRLFDEICPA
jgi:hypothetical protein